MRHWQMARQGLQSLFLVALILVSCAAPGGDNPQEGCGGLEAIVSCLQITSIAPTVGGTSTSNVDVHQDICRNPTTREVTSTEAFLGDHNAQVSFLNRRFPTATGGFDMRILGFSVSYSINQCPTLARGCPPLPGFTATGPSLVIPAEGTLSQTFPFVPLRVKEAYVAAGGERFSASLPSYTATYTFTAQSINFNETFTVTGSTEFTIGDFLTSGFTCQGIIE